MKIHCYSIEENGSLTSLDGEDWQRHRAETQFPLWVHVEGGSESQVREMLKPLALHEVLLGMIEDRNSFGARIIPWENALLLVVPAFGDETLNSSAYSASLVLEDLLITLVPSPSERLSEFTQYLRSGINLHKPTISTLVCAQHLFQNDLRVQQAMAVRNRVTALMETLETDAETVTAGDILDLRSQVRVMDADAEEQVYCIELMGPIESPAFSVKGIEDYYQSLLTNARYLDRFTNRLDERGKDLNSQFTLYVQEKTNRKLAVLTVISAIFLPLTLIAGIYGMNFSDMPELGWRHGYPAALLVMGAVAGGLLWVFKRRGWFD